MAYLRAGRTMYSFMARTPTGWKQLTTGATTKKAAAKVEALWTELATEHLAWDILTEVLDKRRTMQELVAGWEAAKHKVPELRLRFFPPAEAVDQDVAALVEPWATRHRQRVRPDSADHALHHVRWLLPAGTVRLASSVTTLWLDEQLTAYPGSQGTRRKVHSSWSVFFDYLTNVRGIFAVSPMSRVERPPKPNLPIRFYHQEEVEAIVDAQPTPERRAYMALVYGTACDVSVALQLRRADVWDATREIRAAGTKAYNRDRMARVAEWAWPIVADHCRTLLPTARLFPVEWSRHTVSDWHRETVRALRQANRLREELPLKNSRHHWAVRATIAGAPPQVVAAQLGHCSPQLVLSVYGRFIPTTRDRDRWEAAATEAEAVRRAAVRVG